MANEPFKFNCPFVDLGKEYEETDFVEKLEKYFDMRLVSDCDHENDEITTPVLDNGASNDVFFTPFLNLTDDSKRNQKRSMSVPPTPKNDSIDSINNMVSDLHLNGEIDGKQGGVKKRIVKQRSNSCTNTSKCPPKSSKYVSDAEKLAKFHLKTPVRFHSKPKTEMFQSTKLTKILTATIPHSPALLTRGRYRPPNNILTTEQRELKEFEEAQKFKIKSHPVNKKVFNGPIKPTVPIIKKPNTIPEPFNLTQNKKKDYQLATKEPQFHANGVPPFPKPQSTRKQLTKPITPNVLKRSSKIPKNVIGKRSQSADSITSSSKLTRTIIQPFSFDRKIEQTFKKRENLEKQYLEELKRKREFHARPLPKSILEPKGIKPAYSSNDNVHSVKSDEENVIPFKAQPPTVLYKQPFVPKKVEHPLIEINEFQLNVLKRSEERKEFNERLKRREEEKAELLKKQQEMEMKRIQEEIAMLRKQQTYVAKPIRTYKELVPVEAKPLTLPSTPKLLSRKHKESID